MQYIGNIVTESYYYQEYCTGEKCDKKVAICNNCVYLEVVKIIRVKGKNIYRELKRCQ